MLSWSESKKQKSSAQQQQAKAVEVRDEYSSLPRPLREIAAMLKEQRATLQTSNRHNTLNIFGDGSFCLRLKTANKRTFQWDFLGRHSAADEWMRVAASVRSATQWVCPVPLPGGGSAPSGLPPVACVAIATFLPFPVKLNVIEGHGKGSAWKFVLDVNQTIHLAEEYLGCGLMLPGWLHNPNDKSFFDFENGRLLMWGVPKKKAVRKVVKLGRVKRSSSRAHGRRNNRQRQHPPRRAQQSSCSSSASCLSTLR